MLSRAVVEAVVLQSLLLKRSWPRWLRSVFWPRPRLAPFCVSVLLRVELQCAFPVGTAARFVIVVAGG